MTAIINIQVQDLTPEWVADIKDKYPGQSMEIRVIPKTKTDLLDEDLFWEIISLLDWSKKKDDAILSPAVNYLATMPVHYIYLFQDMLSEKLYHLDTKEIASHIGEDAWKENEYFSVDQFLYARCCVVANGKTAYNSVIKNAKNMPKDLTFEPILSLAAKAFQLKTNQLFKYFPTYNYETYSNQKGWE